MAKKPRPHGVPRAVRSAHGFRGSSLRDRLPATPICPRPEQTPRGRCRGACWGAGGRTCRLRTPGRDSRRWPVALWIPPGAVGPGPQPRVKVVLAPRPLRGLAVRCHLHGLACVAGAQREGRVGAAGRAHCPRVLDEEEAAHCSRHLSPVYQSGWRRRDPSGTPRLCPALQLCRLPVGGTDIRPCHLSQLLKLLWGPVLTAPLQLGLRADHGDRWGTSALSPWGPRSATSQAPVAGAAGRQQWFLWGPEHAH